MELQLLRFLAMIFGPAITSAARPAATFWGVQIVVAVLVHQDLASLPQAMQWLVSPAALVVAGVLAGAEIAAKHDPDIAGVLRDVGVDNITGAFGAFSAALLFAALGMPEAEAAGLINDAVAAPDTAANLTQATTGLLGATAGAATTEQSLGLQGGIIGAAVALNLGLTWMRSQLLDFVDDFDLGGLWAKLETGGVVGVLVLLPLLPLIGFGVLLLSTVLFAVLTFVARSAERAADQRARVPCESCGYHLRAEASLCPECHRERVPSAEVHTGLETAMQTLRQRSAPPEQKTPA